MAKEAMVWQNVDPAEIKDADAKKAWLAWQKAQDTFESTFIDASRKAKQINDDQSLKFSYRYGKIGVAKVAKGNGAAAGSFNV